MKTVLLLRHAKSSWDDAALSDHDRPLNSRGKHDAPLVGELLKERGLTPDIICSSTAKRARKTAKKVAEACGFTREIQLLDELYLAPPSTYLALVQQLPESVRLPLLVGHNPGLEQLVGAATGRVEAVPTAALVQLQFDAETWSEATLDANATLVGLWRPGDRE